MRFTKQYISEDGKKGIEDFKYKGSSLSLTYKYFWSPFCDWIVQNLIPSYVAPNTITLLALINVAIAHFVMMYYSPDFQQDIPKWVSWLMFFAVFLYQILDNCDGKQARATGSASPLGMLFDHGCDSIVTWMFGMSIANQFHVSNMGLIYWSMVFLCLVPFYFAQWMQYHIGALKFGKINAVDEGLMAVQAIFLVSAIFGQEIWANKFLFGIEFGSIVITVVCLAGLGQCFQFIFEIYFECQKSNKSFLRTLDNLQCVGLLLITHFIIFMYTDIYKNKNLLALYLYGISLGWSKVTNHIQIVHVTKEKYDQWRVSFIVSCSAYFMMCYFGLQKYQTYFVIGVLINSILTYSHLVYQVTRTMASVLKIKIFKITPSENSNREAS